MQFTTAIFALVAATAANAASDLGQFNVTVERSSFANGFSSETVLADFSSDAYSGENVIHAVCKSQFDPANTPQETSGCEPSTFSYTYSGTSLKVQQNVERPDPMTIFGEATVELVAQGVGRTSKGNVIFDATAATA